MTSLCLKKKTAGILEMDKYITFYVNVDKEISIYTLYINKYVSTLTTAVDIVLIHTILTVSCFSLI